MTDNIRNVRCYKVTSGGEGRCVLQLKFEPKGHATG